MKRVVKMVMSVVLAGALFVSGLTGIKAYAEDGPLTSCGWNDEKHMFYVEGKLQAGLWYNEVVKMGEETLIDSIISPYEDWEDGMEANEATAMLYESGTYYYSFISSDNVDPQKANVIQSFNSEYEYTKPATELMPITNPTWEGYTIKFDLPTAIEDARLLCVQLYCDYDFFKDSRYYTGELYNYYDFSWYFLQGENKGRYKARFRVISKDPTSIANSAWSEWSDWLDLREEVDKTATVLEDILSSGASASEKLESLTNNLSDSTSGISKDTLKVGMALDSQIEEKISTIEDSYKSEKNVTVSAPNVASEVSEKTGIEASQISMVGAALNASENDTMALSVTIPEEKSFVSELTDTVQIDIKLTKNDVSQTGELAIPISITMPVPSGVASDFAIYHVHGNGIKERVIYRNNGDGTITFAVTSFSTFVFGKPASSETSESSGGYTASLETHVKNAVAQGAKTVEISGVQTLSIDDMRVLLANPTVSLVMNYTYEGKDYKVIIPAGAAVVDENIPWYGPLWLAGKYGNSYGMATPVGNDYVIAPGDTLAVIAAKLKTTIENLLKLNPYIKDRNVIFAGKTIKY